MGLLEKDKRKFTVIIGSKKCRTYCGMSPSLVAKKVKGKSGAFYLKETTKGSKKKLYGPYSSKKKVVQLGGDPRREAICHNVLGILNNCNDPSKLTEVQQLLNQRDNILKNTYTSLGINEKHNKCDILTRLLGYRSIYRLHDGRNFPLDYCLCELNDEDHTKIELGFYYEKGTSTVILATVKTNNTRNKYYQYHWIRFINFLRTTIIEIEKKQLENENAREKNNNRRFKNLETYINKIRIAKSLGLGNNGSFAQARGGPANSNNNSQTGTKKTSYLLTNNEFAQIDLNPNGTPRILPPQHMMTAVRARGGPEKQNNLTADQKLALLAMNVNNLTAEQKLAKLRNELNK